MPNSNQFKNTCSTYIQLSRRRDGHCNCAPNSNSRFLIEMVDLNLLSDLEDNNVLDILKVDTDLKDYSAKIECELKSVENQVINDYIKESGNIAALHDRISQSDQILERMENLLEEFQVKLVLKTLKISFSS